LYQRAIVRPPGSNFSDGLTTVDLGRPDLAKAGVQHAAYCETLERCGLALTRLPEDSRYPDSTFVEDTAVLVGDRAILTRPGAPSRAGEVAAIRGTLSGFYRKLDSIVEPGTLDGGDVCEAGNVFLIGISRRTNEEGARQLAAILAEEGFTPRTVDIRERQEILHLKSGISCAGQGRLLAIEALASHPALRDFEVIPVEPAESYAANSILVNDRLLIAAGHPRIEGTLRYVGFDVIPLEMSEFQKMDGGLSCLSLRF
jgi:dimethylargininase